MIVIIGCSEMFKESIMTIVVVVNSSESEVTVSTPNGTKKGLEENRGLVVNSSETKVTVLL